MAASLDKIVANLHLNDGADPGEAVDHHRDQSAVAQPEKIRLIGRLWIIGWFLGNGDGVVSQNRRKFRQVDFKLRGVAS
jgi:hypothetical protein